MKIGYIPKAERKKILFLSDDIRTPSGVGVMSREIIEGTAHRYNWVQVGAAVKHPGEGQIVDMSPAVNSVTGLEDSSVIIYPTTGYGNPQLIRSLIDRELPDAILHFTDPRYFMWLYEMEHEIRQHIPILYYNIWDSVPDPKFNTNFYKSCDSLFSISRQTFGINYRLLGEDNITVIENSEVTNEQ